MEKRYSNLAINEPFKWKKGIATLQSMNPDNILEVRDHEEDLVTMKQLAPTDARETLRVMQAPSGTEDPEVEYLKKRLNNGFRRLDTILFNDRTSERWYT